MSSNLAAISPLAVATAFIKQYYLILSANNSFIHKFYKDDSRISFSPNSNAPAVSQPFSSLENVEEKFSWAANSRVDFANGSIDAQESVGGGILVVVTGEMFLEGTAEKKLFVQTFFLKDDGKRAPRRNYFVFNDVFRFLDGSTTADLEVVTPQIEPPNVIQETLETNDEKEKKENVGKPLDKADTLELNGSNDKSETVSESEPEVASEPVPILDESNSSKETEKDSLPSENIELAAVEAEIEVQSFNKVDGASPLEDERKKRPNVNDIDNSSKKAFPKQKQKPPGSWASLVAGSSSKISTTSTDDASAPPIAKSSPKKDKEPNNYGSTINSSERSKKPPRPQEPESESSAPSAGSRASGYGSKGSSSLYIKNVGDGVGESNLRDLFSEYPFKIVNVSFYPSRGYAFVDFADANAVNSIMKENRQTFHINGRDIEVEKKTSDRRRSGGNSSGSGSRGGSSNGGSGNRRSSPKGQRQRSHSGRRLNSGSDGEKRGRKVRSGGGDKKRDSGTGTHGSNSGGN